MNQVTTHLLATVELPIVLALPDTASRLSELIDSFRFHEETTGCYDEVPAYVAQDGSLRFVLFGIPEGENDKYYVLEFSGDMLGTIEEGVRNLSSRFLSSFVRMKNPDSRGYVDLSEELANTLSEMGINGCKPVVLHKAEVRQGQELV